MSELEKQRKERYNKTAKGNFIFTVRNIIGDKSMVETEYESIEKVLHKIKLDLMTSTNYPDLIDGKIEITLRLDESKIIDHQHRKKGEKNER